MARRSEGKATLARKMNELVEISFWRVNLTDVPNFEQSSRLGARTSDNNLNEEILFQSTHRLCLEEIGKPYSNHLIHHGNPTHTRGFGLEDSSPPFL